MLRPHLLFVMIAAANIASADVFVETELSDGTKCTTCLNFDGQCQNRVHILDFQAPFQKEVIITQLGIHGSTVYYAFQPDLKDIEYYKVGYVDYNKPEDHGILEGPKPVSNFRTFDFDDEGRNMYLGGGDAVYDAEDGKAPILHFTSREYTIQNVFYKKDLYFVRLDEKVIVKKEGETLKPLNEFRNIKDFVVVKNNIVVFLNTTGLYASKMGTNDGVYLSKNAFFRGLTTKNKQDAYAWWIDGIYKIVIEDKLNDSKIIKIANIPYIGALTMDPVTYLWWFSSGSSLYRLDPVKTGDC